MKNLINLLKNNWSECKGEKLGDFLNFWIYYKIGEKCFNFILPFKCENNGGWNCEPNEARCGGKKIGGVARGVLLSKSGRKPFVL